MAVYAGKLRHRARIERKSATLDGYGGEVVTWAEFATVWASVEDLAGRELWAAQAEQGEVTTRIGIRYLTGIRAADRVIANGRTFDVLSVVDRTGTGEAMEIMGRELVL